MKPKMRYAMLALNSRNTPKLRALRKRFGATGYGMYWAAIETMGEHGGGAVTLSTLFEWESFADDLASDVEATRAFVAACVDDYGLFARDGDTVSSLELCAQIAGFEARGDALARKRADAGRKGGRARKSQTANGDGVIQTGETSGGLPLTSNGIIRASVIIVPHVTSETDNTVPDAAADCAGKLDRIRATGLALGHAALRTMAAHDRHFIDQIYGIVCDGTGFAKPDGVTAVRAFDAQCVKTTKQFDDVRHVRHALTKFMRDRLSRPSAPVHRLRT